MKKANRSIPISLKTKHGPADKKLMPKRKLPQPVGKVKPAIPPKKEDEEHNGRHRLGERTDFHFVLQHVDKAWHTATHSVTPATFKV